MQTQTLPSSHFGDFHYLCIDFRSFYASVECVERSLDPLTARLVVADPSRGRGTICLAVSPALKKLGVKNRCRLFEIPKGLSYITAVPRMQLYIDYAANIYEIYLRHFAKEDIHVYSIDEAFIDVTSYLNLYHTTVMQLGQAVMAEIYDTTGIPSACGAGTNLYLAKIALDICAKHTPHHMDYLTEDSYRRRLWTHRPLTDFWRIGAGMERRLSTLGIFCMKDIAHAPERLLYDAFGTNAELLIDHAWGREPVTISQIKSYRAKEHSLCSGQVLMRDYSFTEGLLILKEMVDLLCLDLVAQELSAGKIHLCVGYSYGTRPSSSGSFSLPSPSDSVRVLTAHYTDLYRRIVDPRTPIRRITIDFSRLHANDYLQYDLFTDPTVTEKDRKLSQSVNQLRQRFGNNAILKGMNLQEAATTRERNCQIGGHQSGNS